MADSNPLFDLLSEIAAQGRKDAYAAYQKTGTQRYRRLDEPVTNDVVQAHLASEVPIACYFVKSEEVTAAVLDLDDHDKSMDWGQVADAARPIIEKLRSDGMTLLCCRSGGGAGMHIWLFWAAPQKAKLVRQYLRHVLAETDFKSGTGGVQQKEIEIFPKNNRVKEGSYGNAVAIPFARDSRPLNADLEPIEFEDYEAPRLSDLTSPDLADVFAPPVKKPRSTPAARPAAPRRLEDDEEEAREALRFISSDDYEVWTRVGLALKCSIGAAAFGIWDDWSRTSSKYKGETACRQVWESFDPNGDLTIGTVYHMAQERGWDGPTNPVVRDMNARFGILTHGSSTRVIVKQADGDQPLVWLSKSAFIDRLKPERRAVEKNDGSTEMAQVAPFWLSHPKAAHYHELIFDPAEPPGHNGHNWNMWRGFGVEPKPGDWSGLKDHILVNICGGNAELADWMLNWMALGVQRPGEVIGTAPVMIGLPGTGKGVLAHAYGRLWGRHYISVTNEDHVSGRFNQHFLARRFIYVDEAMFGGDRRNASVIKTMLTEPRIMIEAKGVDPIWLDNHMIFMVTSNERSVVPADIGDRRWQVIEVGDARREDRNYFSAIAAQMEAGGYEAMLFDLLRRDVSAGPDPHITIRTPELFDQIIQAQGPIERYLYQVLDAGCLPQPDAPGNGPGITTIGAMYADMRNAQPKAQYIQQTLFGRTISRVFPGVTKVQSGRVIVSRGPLGRPITERSTRYQFPPLRECRRAFEFYIGQEVPWSNDLDDWLGDVDPADDYSALNKASDEEAPF